MPKLRTIQEITDEITQCVGYFPPFFEPALDSAAVLENLWHQAWSAYLTSTIPLVFKEKLGALLGQQLEIPYCLICHASTLSPLGVIGADILNVLTKTLPDLHKVPPGLKFLQKFPVDRGIEIWPASNSDFEDVLLDAALVMFFEQDGGQTANKLKAVLPGSFFNQLILLLSYNRTSMQWVKVHPEISYENDQRYLVYYDKIVAEEPRLASYFRGLLTSWKDRDLRPNGAMQEFEAERKKITGERDSALRLLQQEKDWLAQIIDHAPFSVSMLSAGEHRFVIANKQYCAMLGKTQDFILGKTRDEVFPEFSKGDDWDEYERIWEDGLTIDLSEKSFSDPVRERFFRVVRQARRGEGGEIESVLTYSLEITDQVSAKRATESQKLWLESILNCMPVGLVLVETGTGALLFSNDLASDVFNDSWALEKDQGISPHVIDDKGRRLSFDEFPTTRAARGEIIRDEIVQVRTQRGDFFISANADPLPPIPGHPSAVVIALHDITASKMTEFAIENSRRDAEISESRLMLAVEASQLGFWEYDLRTQHVEWSETYRKQFDYPPGQYGGAQADTLTRIHPDDRPRVEETFAGCLAEGKPFHVVYRVISGTGKITWIEGRGRYQYDEFGSLIRMHGTCLDVSETKSVQDELQSAKENAERANEAKSAFLANMSHEIRTPLTAIMGYTDLLKEEDLSPQERSGFIDIINRNGKALTKLIEDILDLSKVEAGKLATENGHFSLRALLTDVMLIFKDSAANKGIELLIDTAENTPDSLVTDAVRLRQILVNIIGNAVKFTSHGHVKVFARVVGDSGDNLLKIEVEDTGIGLTGDEMNRLFQPFVQADNSTSRRYGGTGLGLALSRRLASALGGNISILGSEPMRGSCFLVEVQVDIASEADESIAPAETVSLHRDVLNGVKILLVEDAPDNSLLISNMLGYYGAEVETAGNGRDGVDMAMAGMYDVVLMDIQMPLMDGYEAFQRLKSNHYQPPIIALTAHAMLEEKRLTQQIGFVAHITKPIDPIELISCVQKFSHLHRNLPSINPY